MDAANQNKKNEDGQDNIFDVSHFGEDEENADRDHCEGEDAFKAD